MLLLEHKGDNYPVHGYMGPWKKSPTHIKLSSTSKECGGECPPANTCIAADGHGSAEQFKVLQGLRNKQGLGSLTTETPCSCLPALCLCNSQKTIVANVVS